MLYRASDAAANALQLAAKYTVPMWTEVVRDNAEVDSQTKETFYFVACNAAVERWRAKVKWECAVGSID